MLQIIVAEICLPLLFRGKRALIWAEELLRTEFMQEKHFISLGSGILQGTEPQVTSDCRQLLGQWQDVQVHHELVGKESVLLRMLNELHYPFRFEVELRQQVVIEFLPLGLELSLCQIRQIVVRFADKFLRAHICVDQESPASRNPWKPLAA